MKEDLTGRRFGMLTVLGYDHSFNRNTYWLCECDCGNTKVVKRGSLMGGDIVLADAIGTNYL